MDIGQWRTAKRNVEYALCKTNSAELYIGTLGMLRQKILNPWLVLQSKHSFKPFDYTVYLDSKFRHCDYTSYATQL